ncbi:MAG TPA: nuclear transport factor 2 family protein [Ilumatobacteraceae bacterium]|nr:nuclear transport factor 2 family protein [Ilumatobacteraceae bacterium]
MTVSTQHLRHLAETYAAAVDRGDAERFISAFHPDAALYTYSSADHETPQGSRIGHEQLAKIPGMLRRYTRTFHMLGQSTYDIGPDRATGEVYCLAHHLTVRDDGTANDHVMLIRYQDDYEPNAEGEWKIRQRRVVVDWTEQRQADPPVAR